MAQFMSYDFFIGANRRVPGVLKFCLTIKFLLQ
jgi:hypothetical protein